MRFRVTDASSFVLILVRRTNNKVLVCPLGQPLKLWAGGPGGRVDAMTATRAFKVSDAAGVMQIVSLCYSPTFPSSHSHHQPSQPPNDFTRPS